MRIAAIEKLGYYPTPVTVVDQIARWICPPNEDQPWRLLDPCCGMGEAAARLAQLVGGKPQTWGVELAPARAEAAGKVLDCVHNAAWQEVRVTEQSVSLLFLNPPYDYDYDGDEQRIEIEFLRSALKTLAYGGILIYIVPLRLLSYQAAARLLVGNFEHLVVRRFPDGEYERFSQVVVFGVRKPWTTPTAEETAQIRALSDTIILPLTPDTGPVQPWPVPLPVPPLKAHFRRTVIPDREKVARAFALGWPDELVEAMQPRQRADIRPLVPLKKGHVAMLMSSGLLGTMRLEKNGQRLLVKGRVVKKASERTEEDEKGNEVTIKKDRFVTTVGIVDEGGARVVSDVNSLTAFMEDYGDAVAAQILSQQPLYDLNPTAEEWAVVNRLGKGLPLLLGQTEPGLLEVQKHAAIAMARSCKAYHHALTQGEMGLGKTCTSLATIELLGAYPALVVCPPHLVGKWMREAQQVVEGIQVRELKRIGDVIRFIDDWNAGRLGKKAIAVSASTSVKLGSGWDGATVTRRTLPRGDAHRSDFRTRLAEYKAERRKLMNMLDPQQMARIDELIARLEAKVEQTIYEPQQKPWEEDLERLRKAHSQQAIEEQRRKVAQARRAALEAAVSYPVCPDCGQVQMEEKEGGAEIITDAKVFSKKPHACDRPVSGWALDESGRRLHGDDGRPVWSWGKDATHRSCGGRLYSFGNGQFHRWPIADYIADHHRGFFRLLVADEVHEYKGKDSDRGLAFHRLINATRYCLALTGTYYGGKSTSIFWLMHRMKMGGVQRDFAYNDEKRWAERYGVLETRIYGKKDATDDDADFGAFNATRRAKVIVQERPGISPAILERIIASSIFLSLKDLGLVLPPYSEEIAIAQMMRDEEYPEFDQADQYGAMEASLRALARQDRRFLSTWLQWSLARPNSGFRYEEVVKDWRDDDGNVVRTEVLFELPALVDGKRRQLPKEEWLANFCQAEMRAGRKVIVYARQTGTRDIQPRLEDVLRPYLRARVLHSNVEARKREEWLERHAPGMDVLIVNPRLVQTGLDLVQFCTVVWYEIDYSLYVMWQAMRRVWRIGQTKPVKVVFTAYANTLEEQALALMGQKMRAAQLLFGDEVGGAIVPEDDGDFLTELARAVLDDLELPDLQRLFAASAMETTSAMGSPTAKSPRLPVYTDEQIRQMWLEQLQQRGTHRRKAVVPAELQPALF